MKIIKCRVCYKQRNKTRRRDKETGLANTLYKVSARRELVIDTAPVTFLDIQLGESHIQGIDTVMTLVYYLLPGLVTICNK